MEVRCAKGNRFFFCPSLTSLDWPKHVRDTCSWPQLLFPPQKQSRVCLFHRNEQPPLKRLSTPPGLLLYPSSGKGKNRGPKARVHVRRETSPHTSSGRFQRLSLLGKQRLCHQFSSKRNRKNRPNQWKAKIRKVEKNVEAPY